MSSKRAVLFLIAPLFAAAAAGAATPRLPQRVTFEIVLQLDA